MEFTKSEKIAIGIIIFCIIFTIVSNLMLAHLKAESLRNQEFETEPIQDGQ